MYLERDWGGRLRAPVAQRALGCHLGLKCAWPHPWVGWAGQVDPHAVCHGAWVPSLLLWIQRGHRAERASWQHRLVPSGKRTPPSVGPAETVHRPVLCSRGRHGVNSASVGTLLLGGLGVTRPRQALSPGWGWWGPCQASHARGAMFLLSPSPSLMGEGWDPALCVSRVDTHLRFLFISHISCSV